ncbi:MAG: response regulator transcription factor [Proteobacteria bacterium]|nr:response regulator transcription factor [Pseudomonadota bacterium]
MIRIVLVDDHTLVREALRLVLEQDSNMQVVGEAGDGETALQMVEQMVPDVVVMDVGLPGISGIETTRRLLAKHQDIKVLALSTHLDHGVVQQMLDTGAYGYIVKAAAGAELKNGIRSVIEGRIYLCPEVIGLLVADSLRERRTPVSRKSDNHSLTWRERQVTTLIAGGRPKSEIAAMLHIAPSTVDVHRRNVMKKLELHNVVDLTKYAIRHGLVLP